MKRYLASTLFAAALAFPAAVSAADKCPISGEDVDPAISLSVNGKDVGFCCNKCLAKYEKQIHVTDDGAKECPISGKAADAEERIIHSTVAATAFCCEKCQAKFAEEKGIEMKDEGPGKCPISGKDASPDQSVNVDGKKTYFCCEKCQAKFVANLGAKTDGAAKCPVSGKDADAATTVYVTTSKAVYFCCEKCKGKYTSENFAAAK